MKKDEAKARILGHCVVYQVFIFNDLSIIADMYLKEEDYENALMFLEAEIKSYEPFLDDEGGNVNGRMIDSYSKILDKLYE